MLEQQVAHRADLPGAALRRGVVDRPTPGRRPPRRSSRCRDDVPRLEPVGQRDHRVVVAQRCADAAGDGLRGGHRRDHPDVARPATAWPPRARRSPSRTRRDRPTRPPRRRGPAGPACRPARARAGSSVLSLGWRRWPSRAATRVEVGPVADEVGRRGQFAAALRRHPVGVARARGRPPRRCPAAVLVAPPSRAASPARSTARWTRRRRPRAAPAARGVLARST